MANGTNPLGLLNELAELGECTIVANTGAIPPLGEIDPTQLYVGWSVTLTTEQPRSAIDDVFIFVMDDMELEITQVEDTSASQEIVPPPAPVEEAAKANPQLVQAATDGKQGRAAENVRVPAERLDELMDLSLIHISEPTRPY